MQYLDRYTPEQARRHEVKPGLTGWAQVNGRNAISWEEKFKLDVWYVDNQSFWLDMKIILMTVKKVLKREGISALGEATMPEFNPRITQISADEKKRQIDPQITQISADLKQQLIDPPITQIDADYEKQG
jgi:sugar transferase EpsL